MDDLPSSCPAISSAGPHPLDARASEPRHVHRPRPLGLSSCYAFRRARAFAARPDRRRRGRWRDRRSGAGLRHAVVPSGRCAADPSPQVHQPLACPVAVAAVACTAVAPREAIERRRHRARCLCRGRPAAQVLDSVVGDIWWFAPFVDRPFALFTVPALYKPWWLNFFLHWSFALELAICAWALATYRRRRRTRPIQGLR